MSNSKSSDHKPERGTWLTIALIVVIVHNLFMTVIYWTTPDDQVNRPLLLGIMVAASALSVVAGIAMWYWKRWGTYAYALAAVAGAVLALLLTGSLTMLFGAILPPIIVGYILRPKLQYFD